MTGKSETELNPAVIYLRNRHLLVLTIIVLVIGGLASIINLPRLEDPRITNRGATVLTFYPGASASLVEALVNEKIEDTLEEIDEIKTIESTAKPNVSSISIELDESTTDANNEEIFSKIRSRLQNVNGELPRGATNPVLDDNRGVTAYTYIIGISWNGEGDTQLNLLNRVAQDVKDRMLNTPSTELVRIFGGIDEEILVTPEEGELAALGLSVSDLAGAIARADSKVSAGQLRASNNNLQIEVTGSLETVERISRIPLAANEEGSILTVGDLANVERSYKNPPEQIGLRDGLRTLFVGVRADDSVRVDRWASSASETLQEIQNDYSDLINIDLIFDQNEYTQARLNDLVSNLVLGALLVVAIVLFTMGWKSALVVGSVLPLTAAGTLFAFNVTGQSIHQMSIFGMIIAIGLLIDCAIVMTDEVRKSIQSKGLNRLDATRRAVRHLFIPLLASTFTTVLGFTPILLLPGNAGDFVSPIAISVIIALWLSLFLAMTIIPALAAGATAERKEDTAQKNSWWRSGLKKPKVFEDFRRFTLHAAKRPIRYLLLTALPCFAGFLLVGTMKVEFFPAADRDMFEVQVYLPSDSSIEYTKTSAQIADTAIKEIENVTAVHWLIGASTPIIYYNSIPTQDNNSAYAQAIVTATDNLAANQMIPAIQKALSEALPNARPVVKKFAQGPPVEAPVAFRIVGPDIDTLRTLGEQVRGILHSNTEVVHSRATIEGGQAKLWFEADEAEAERLGLDLASIATRFETSLEGSVGGSVLEGVEELPVRVRLSDEERSTLVRAGNLQLASPSGQGWIPAEALGQLELRPEVAQISRYNGQRVNNIFGYIRPNAKAVSVATEVMNEIEERIKVPTGYAITVAGDSEEQAEAIGGLATYTPVLLVLVAATLILAFRSVWLAGIVFLVALLSVGLGLLSLKIAGFPLGFNPLIGSIGLAGVAINGAIVVLAAIASNDRARKGDVEQIVAETYGCGRHIISTTLTTIGGFIPLLLFSGGSFWPPLAVVIAGGMGFSLLLTMFFTPLAYKVYSSARTPRSETQSEPQLEGSPA